MTSYLKQQRQENVQILFFLVLIPTNLLVMATFTVSSKRLANKNSAEVDIAPAFGVITTACNVGQAKKGHGVCLKSGQLVYARFHTHSHRKILTKPVEREIKVKGTRSRCLLKECVKDNYYARYHPHS